MDIKKTKKFKFIEKTEIPALSMARGKWIEDNNFTEGMKLIRAGLDKIGFEVEEDAVYTIGIASEFFRIDKTTF